jgi:signal transduction histidine kinase
MQSNGIGLEQINRHLDTAILVEAEDGAFSVLGEIPAWLDAFFEVDLEPDQTFRLEQTLVFFESYIDEVRETLAADPEAIVGSGPWSEADRSQVERNLSAAAFVVNGRIVMQVKLIGSTQLYHQAVFQKAREYSLNYEKLIKERERKDVLLHTVVHDLTGPLTAITGALWLIADQLKDHDDLVQLALKQCEVEKEMILSILDSFSAEYKAFDVNELTSHNAPDIVACVNRTLATFRPAFKNQQVELTVKLDVGDLSNLQVVAEDDLLERVLSNLMQNALRFSPPGSDCNIELSLEGDWITVTVCDQGPGVDENLKSTIFERFSGGRRQGGNAGLGLYFCRITLDRWGGTIGCESNDPTEPGTRMWFTLRRFES